MIKRITHQTPAQRTPHRESGAGEAGSHITKSGFTIIELMIVVVIIGLITGLSIPAFNAFNRRQALSQAAKELKTALRVAQSNSVNGVGGERWGVRVVRNTNYYETFSTPNYNFVSGTRDELSVVVVVTSVSPSSGDVANVIFEKLTGAPGVYRDDGVFLGNSITVALQNTGGSTQTRYVKVNSSGGIWEE